MSRVTVSGLQSGAANGAITVSSNYVFHQSGSVIQTVWSRTDSLTSYSSAASGNGAQIAPTVTIVPKFASSIILVTWMINGEFSTAAWENVFLIWKNNALITTAGYEGYNSLGGNNRWSGFVGGQYDTNAASTPENYRIQYWAPAGSTESQVYGVAVRSATGTAHVFYLNRTVTAPQDNHEVQISTAMAQEIAQ